MSILGCAALGIHAPASILPVGAGFLHGTREKGAAWVRQQAGPLSSVRNRRAAGAMILALPNHYAPTNQRGTRSDTK